MAIVINQLATPGLGSWITGHRVAGVGQMALGCVALIDVLVHSYRFLAATVRNAFDGLAAPGFPSESWNRALCIFGIAWIWAAVTSLQMFLELRRLAPVGPPPTLRVPPTLS